MESFRRNHSENIFSNTGIFLNKIFHKESFRIDFLAKPEFFRMESFRRKHSETTFSANYWVIKLFLKDSF
jgi:hypothetical protein